MPINVFMVNGNMTKYKSLPLYESCFLNYDIRRNKNPIKVNEYAEACHIIRPVMHAGNLWDKIKTGFNKVKNVFKKGMDFIDNNEITKSLKDSALNYIGQKTGVDVNKIYDTAHKVIDVIPDIQETQPDPNDYYNYRQNQYTTTGYSDPYTNTYTNPSYTYTNPGYTTNQSYNYPQSYNYSNTYPSNTASYNSYQQPIKTPITNKSSYTVANTTGQNSLQNQVNNTYNQIMKQPLTQPQQAIVKQNRDRFAFGINSCGMVDINKIMKNKTFMRNIPKMLVMSSAGSITSDFKPVLEKFGIKTLTIPKTMKNILDKIMKNQGIPNKVISGPGSAIAAPRLGEPRVASVIASKVVEKTDESNGRLNLGRGDKSCGSKSSKYQDILNKLKSNVKK